MSLPFIGDLPRGATVSEVIERLGDPEATGSPSRGDTLLGYRDLTLQLFFSYGRLDLVGCYFDRGDQSMRDWPGPIHVPPELNAHTSEAELVEWLEGQETAWSHRVAAGDVRSYALGDDVSISTEDGRLRAIFITCGGPSLGREELLEQAVQLVQSGGLDYLTLGRLAWRTGMSKSSIARYFKTKEQLRAAAKELLQ